MKSTLRRLSVPLAIVAAAAVLGAAVVAAAMWADQHLDSANENLPDWIEALSTLAAFIAAGVAVWFAAGAFRLERQREERWATEQRRDQASLIAAWAGTPFCAYGGLNAVGVSEVTGIEGTRVLIRNSSNLPVTDIQLTVFVRFGDVREDPPQPQYLCHKTLAFVPPGEEPQAISITAPAHVSLPPGKSIDSMAVLVAFAFTDASGVRWVRSPRGKLTEDARFSEE